jgi:CMP-N-acetylneuraminic acid synthetase
MVPVLLIRRAGSRGLPGQNTMPTLGRPLMVYPILAANNSRHVGPNFLSTDGESVKDVGASTDWN